MTWVDGSKTVYKVQWLTFIVHFKTLNVPTVYSFEEQLDISRLCHTKLCINLLHLTLEKQSVNMSRNKCRKVGVCTMVHGAGDSLYAFKPSMYANTIKDFKNAKNENYHNLNSEHF